MKQWKLFEPGAIGGVGIKNRLVVPPMVTNFGGENNRVTDQLIAYHTARARGGFGLIIVEDFAVHPLGKGFLRVPALWSDDFIEGCRSLTDSVHGAGSRIFAQIYHAGAQTRSQVIGEQPMAPSPVLHPWYQVLPRELTEGEIYEIITAFGKAARRAMDAGFDGVEVHGSHGYLVAQFMSPYTNKRTDAFGGDLMGRLKFPLEIVQSIRSETGTAFPVILRMAGDERILGGRELEETRVMAPLLEEGGYDALHVTTATTGNMAWIAPCNYAPIAVNANYAEVVRRNVNIPVITTGRIYDPLVAEGILREGRADFIGMGRASIADPELPNKVAGNRLEDIRPCIGCLQGCIGYLHKGKGIRCLSNPEVGLEREMEIRKASRQRRVAVVGGGPAGLEASRTAALAGHEVVLYERRDRLGGQLNLASVPLQKHEIAGLVKYLITQVKKTGVRIRLNEEFKAHMAGDFDAIVLATGGQPRIPNISGADKNHVMDSWTLLSGKKTTGEKVAVIGGGLVGCETALLLASQRKHVTLVEMLDRIAWDTTDRITFFLFPLLEEAKVEIRLSAEVLEILTDAIKVRRKGRVEEWQGYETVVLATGTLPVESLSTEIGRRFPEIAVEVIGDAAEPRSALEAIAEGARAGRAIIK